MNKTLAIAMVHAVILERFPPGDDRDRWLQWLRQLSQADKALCLPDASLLETLRRPDPPPRLH